MGSVICSPALGGIIETEGKVARAAFACIVWLFLAVGQHLQFQEFWKFLSFIHRKMFL